MTYEIDIALNVHYDYVLLYFTGTTLWDLPHYILGSYPIFSIRRNSCIKFIVDN